MLMLVAPALAGPVATVPPGAETLAVLVCPWEDTCDADSAWVSGVQGVGEAPFVPLELLLERDNGGFEKGVDTRATLAAAVGRASAAAEKGRWGAVATAVADAKVALAAVHGDVNTETLFTIAFLEGAAARAKGSDRGHEYSFRQAAAILSATDEPPKLPPHDDEAGRAWLDEQRKLMVGGTGTLALSGPPRVRWSVDGVTQADGIDELTLLPGNHRLVATLPGTVRSWTAEAPVLAGRTVSIQAGFTQSDSARWVQQQIEGAFDTLQAPPEVTHLLAEWSRRNHLTALRVLRVEDRPLPPPPAAPQVGEADPLRPAAADGERVDHGDGIPSTYTDEVLSRDEANRDKPPGAPERRLRVMWFDPTLERFALDAGPVVVRTETEEPRFRVSLHVGYTSMMDHHHVAADVGGAWRAFGPIAIEGRIGLVRADSPYNLYARWVDQQLYHASLAARWAPDWKVAPFVSLGPELYVPAAFGARLSGGVQVRMERNWLGALEAHGSYLDQGPSWGIGLGLGRVY